MPHPDLLYLMATRLMHHLENILKDDVSGKRKETDELEWIVSWLER